jgi:hypothetical protein
MDFNVIMQAISTVGFPIVMCLVFAWYIKDLNESHKVETEKFTDALNANTLVLQKLCDAMNVEREE